MADLRFFLFEEGRGRKIIEKIEEEFLSNDNGKSNEHLLCSSCKKVFPKGGAWPLYPLGSATVRASAIGFYRCYHHHFSTPFNRWLPPGNSSDLHKHETVNQKKHVDLVLVRTYKLLNCKIVISKKKTTIMKRRVYPLALNSSGPLLRADVAEKWIGPIHCIPPRCQGDTNVMTHTCDKTQFLTKPFFKCYFVKDRRATSSARL